MKLRDNQRGITPSIRNMVLPAGQITYCAYCGFVASEVDHIVARSRGGGLDPENLNPACHECNLEKLDMTIEEWAELRIAQGKPWPIPTYTQRIKWLIDEHSDLVNPESAVNDQWLHQWPGGYDAVRAWLIKARDRQPGTGDQVRNKVTK